MEVLLTTLDGGSEARWFPSGEYPWGANVAYRRAELLAVGGFSERLGRVGRSLLSGEEYLLNALLERRGGRFYYQPGAAVAHWIPKERVEAGWMIRRSHWQGRSVALIEGLLGRSPLRQRLGSAWNLCRSAVRIDWLVGQFWPDPKVSVPRRMIYAWRWGYFLQAWFAVYPRGTL
jgi:hypothetical protein